MSPLPQHEHGGALLVARQCGVVHLELAVLDLQREVLCDNTSGQRLVVYLATPGSQATPGSPWQR